MTGHPQPLPYKEDKSALCQTMWQHRPHRRCDDSAGGPEFHIRHGILGIGCPLSVAGLCLGSHPDSVTKKKKSLTATYLLPFKSFPINQTPSSILFSFLPIHVNKGFLKF
jgi:hypothetical protein